MPLVIRKPPNAKKHYLFYLLFKRPRVISVINDFITNTIVICIPLSDFILVYLS